jgi:hypothetical protein
MQKHNMFQRHSILAAGAALLAAATPVVAQTSVNPANPPAAASPNQVIPEKDRSRPVDQPPSAGGNLSDKLNKTGGVIAPPSDVDPDMRKPAPSVGTTPVVPPPGTPGGNQRVDPK